MIPLYDENPTRRFPWVTLALVLANVAVFVFELTLAGQGRLDTFIASYAFEPARFLSQPLAPAQWATILTSMFLHGGFLHIGGNMLYLWIFGNNIEDRLGRLPFLGFYLVAGVVATVGQALADPSSAVPNIGASGAIAGILGAYLLLYPRARVVTAIIIIFFIELVRIPAVLVIGIWFVLQLASGIGSLNPSAAQAGGVAYFAHIGGFAAGALMALPVLLADRYRRARFVPWR